MTGTGVRTEIANGVCRVTLDRPEKRNALTVAGRLALRDAVVHADRDPQVGVVVVTGAGGHFCSGGDIGEFTVRRDHEEAHKYAMQVAQAVFTTVRAMQTPTVARVESLALGLTRAALDRSLDVPLGSFLKWEAGAIATTMATDAHRERVEQFLNRSQSIAAAR